MHEEHEFKSKTGLRRILNAMRYSLEGFKAAYQFEAAFRQELVLAALLIPIALLLPVTPTQSAFMIAAVTLVLIVELINSAIEATVDRISLERHELAKRAKDVGSAAVMLAILNCAVVWGLVLYEALRP